LQILCTHKNPDIKHTSPTTPAHLQKQKIYDTSYNTTPLERGLMAFGLWLITRVPAVGSELPCRSRRWNLAGHNKYSTALCQKAL
jgi:hypothetical protein